MSNSILKIENLKKHYAIRKGLLNKQVATKYVIDGIDLEVKQGQTVALIGESGCGKTVLLRTLLGLEDLTSGKIYFEGNDVSTFTKQQRRSFQTKVQMIFQDSLAALHPRFTIGESLEEPLLLNGMMTGKAQRHQRVVETLYKVGLDSSYCTRYSRTLSGGQRQRVVIARALVERPDLILADEPISALDVSLQAQVLNLLMDLKDEFRLSMLFVAHDLAVVRQIAEYILIMYAGLIVEAAPANEIYGDARHPYTRVLLKSAPSIKKGIAGKDFHLDMKVGDTPDSAKLPGGCLFNTRCVYALDSCIQNAPCMREVSPGHYVRCDRMEKINRET